MVNSTVTLLQLNAADLRLDIAQACLGFDPDDDTAATDHGIPCPQVSRCRNGHLGSPLPRGSQPGPEPLEQSQVRFIAQRRTDGVRPSGQFQPHHAQQPGHVQDLHTADSTALDATHVRVGHLRRSSDGSLAEPGADAGQAQLLTQLGDEPAAATVSAVDGPLSCRHALMVMPGAYLPVGCVRLPIRSAAHPDHALLPVTDTTNITVGRAPPGRAEGLIHREAGETVLEPYAAGTGGWNSAQLLRGPWAKLVVMLSVSKEGGG